MSEPRERRRPPIARAAAALGPVLLILLAPSARGTSRSEPAAPCDPPAIQHAYSHNDYRRSRPFESAAELGYAGVEADLHYVRGRLLVGHDLEETRPERTFDAVYLTRLEERRARCGRVGAGAAPFWLFVDLKTRGMPGYRALRSALAAHAALFTAVRDGVETPGSVTVVLVGWCPPLDSLRSERVRYVSVHRPLGAFAPEDRLAPSHLVRLVSLEASKLPGWSGKGNAPRAWADAFERLRAARAAGKVTRVHHLRVNARLYAYALRQGVDLIGTTDLAGSSLLWRSYFNSASP